MEIEVRFFATLRKRYAPIQKIAHPGTEWTVEGLLAEIELPLEKAAIIFRNGKHIAPGDTIYDGDTISVFPPIGGG
jgi:sulfur-carrier protein